MTLDRDPLVWLLPDAPRRQERAQAVVTGLRLLRSAGRSVASPSVGVSGPRARHELERRSNDAHTSALEDLLRHHLGSVQDADAVLWFGWPRLSTDRAWRRLLEAPRHKKALSLEPPTPAEDPLDVAERLIAAAEWAPARAALWQARLAWIRGTCEAAQDIWKSLATDPAWAMDVAVDRAAVELECGHVRRAFEHLGLEGVQEHPRGRRLKAWCDVALGKPPSRTDGLLDSAEGGPVPAGILAWRTVRSAWAGILTGPKTAQGVAARAIPIPEDRDAIGAVVFGVFVLDARRGWIPLCCDLAPALESRRRAWMISRQDSWTVKGAPEQELIGRGEAVLRWSDDAGHQSTLLGAVGAASRVLALVPIHDQLGEVAGWLHAEWEHDLIPSRERMQAWADGWRDRVLTWSGPRIPTEPKALRLPVDGPIAWGLSGLGDALGIGLGRRRWYAVSFGPDGAQLLAHGGGGLPFEELRAAVQFDRAHALKRVRRTSCAVVWDKPTAGLGVHPRAASGRVEPLIVDGHVLGAFVLESARRRDLGPHEIECMQALLPRAVLEVTDAVHRLSARLAGTRDPVFPMTDPAFATFARRWITSARSRRPVTLVGPAGSGKRILGQWLLSVAQQMGRKGGTCLTEPTRLSPRAQARLARRLQSEARHGCTVVTLRVDPNQAGLDPELAGCLNHAVFRIPALHERRSELFAWIDGLLSRAAEDERVDSPRLDAEAYTLLWRQSWVGGLRDLDAALHRLVRLAPGTVLGEADVVAHLASIGVCPEAGPSSRRPLRADLLAAVACTRNRRGRVNKTRAAALLGWDPDTLVLRLNDIGVDPDDPPSPGPWPV
jgi:hypothetical protein